MDLPHCNNFQCTEPPYHSLGQEKKPPDTLRKNCLKGYSAPLMGAEILEVGNLNGLTEYRSLPTETTRCSVDLQVTG